jgi:predicted  nucleic acid-binding Zn-ribbon protein
VSPVSEEVERLWRLHELDERANTARAAVVRFPEQKALLESRVTGERTRLAAQTKAAEELLKTRRKIEQEIEAVTAQQRQFESRQPSVKTNDEFRALTAEIDGCKLRRSELETQVLMRFEEEESLAKQKPVIEQALRQAESERAARLAEIERAETASQAELDAINAERATEIAALGATTRQRYERIHSQREGRAVVPVIKNACGGCFRAQPPQLLQDIRRGDRLLICDGCGRILVLPPGEA